MSPKRRVRWRVVVCLVILAATVPPTHAFAQGWQPSKSTDLTFGPISGNQGMFPRFSFFNASDDVLHIRFQLYCVPEGDLMAEVVDTLGPRTGKVITAQPAFERTTWDAILHIEAGNGSRSGPADWATFPQSYQILSAEGNVVVQAVEHDAFNQPWLYLGPHSFNPGEVAQLSYFNWGEPLMVTMAFFDMASPGKPLLVKTETVEKWRGMVLDLHALSNPINANVDAIDARGSRQIFAAIWAQRLRPGGAMRLVQASASMQVLDEVTLMPKLFIAPNYADVK